MAQQGNAWTGLLRLRNTCGGDEIRLPIEPLVGLLRHPTAHSDCQHEGDDGVYGVHNDSAVVTGLSIDAYDCASGLPSKGHMGEA